MLSNLELLCSAMATKEGWYAPLPNLPRTNNNPGDLRASPLTRPKDKYGFVTFKSAPEGIACLYWQVLRYAIMGWSIRQLITAWAPPQAADGGNNTAGYISDVQKWTGLDVDVPMWTFLPCENMITYAGNKPQL